MCYNYFNRRCVIGRNYQGNRKFFRVQGLPAVQHTEETKAILDSLNGSRSDFIREAILKFANDRGFEQADLDFIGLFKSHEIKLEIKTLVRSNARMKRKIDYGYIFAFWWLKSQSEFKYISLSALQRLIICQSSPSQTSSRATPF